MSDMKCPICQTVLDKALINDKIRGCPKCRNMGNIELWQELIRTRKALETGNKDLSDKIGKLETELERTRKALDVALDEINKIKVAAESVGIGFFMTAAISASVKIKTALEQKDVK